MKRLRVTALTLGSAYLLTAVAAQTNLVPRALKKSFRMVIERTIAPAEQVRHSMVEVASMGLRAFQEKRELPREFERRHSFDPQSGNNRRATLALPQLQRSPSLTNDRDLEEPRVSERPSIQLTLTPALVASSQTWDRGAGTGFWTDAVNWNPDGVPGSGDSVIFTDTGAGVVDLNGTTQPASGSLGGLTFNNVAIGYTLQNGTINLGGNTLTQNSGSSVTNIISAQLNSTGAININSGTLVLTNAGNNIAGAVTVNGGGLQLGNGANATSLSGVNAPDANSDSQGSAGGVAVTVNNSASVNVQALATLTGGAGATNLGTPMGLNGGGGNGAAAILYNGAGSLINGGTIIGGAGGAETGSWGGGPTASGGAGGTGVVFTSGGSFSNTGTIRGGKGGDGSWQASGNGGDGVSFTGSGTWLNTGSIFGGDGGNDLSSASSGGSGGIGVIFGSTGPWTNNGTIGGGDGGTSNNNGPGSGGIGVLLSNGGMFTNNLTINGGSGASGNNGNSAGSGGTGVYFQAFGSLINSGTITGADGGSLDSFGDGGAGGHGVFLNAGGSVTNSGTIQGGAGGSGGFIMGSPGAAGKGVIISGAAGTFWNKNSGSILGGVSLGNFANSVTLEIGSSIAGGLDIGTSAASMLFLTDDGTGGTQTYSTAVDATTFSGTLIKNGIGTWTMDIALSNIAGATVNAGTLTLSGSADNLGLGATVNGGTLILAKNSSTSPDVHAIGAGGLTIAGGTAQLAGAGGDQIYDGANVNMSGGTFDLNGRNETINNLNGAAGVVTNTNASGSILTIGNGGNFSGALASSSYNLELVKNGGGTLTLAGTSDNSFLRATVNAGTLVLAKDSPTVRATADVSVNGGTLQLAGAGGDQIYDGSSVTMSGGTFDMNGRSETIGNLNATAGTITDTASATTSTLTVSGGGGFGGTISDGTGQLVLVKSGAAALTLSNANTYTGGTAVNGGTLLVTNTSGSATGTGNVAVNSSAILGGNGTISGAVTVNNSGTLAPGNSPGQLHLGNNLTFNTGSNLSIEIGGLIAGSGYDQIQLAGALTLNAPNLLVSLIDGFTPTINDTFFLIDLTSSATSLGIFANAPSGIYTNDGNYFLVNYFDSDPNDPGHTLGNDISLTYLGMTPVPEPSTWVAAALAAAALVWMRRGRHGRRSPARWQTRARQ